MVTEVQIEPQIEPQIGTGEERFHGPTWNCATEYPSITANEFRHDLEQVDHLTKTIQEEIAKVQPQMEAALSQGLKSADFISTLQGVSEYGEQASVLLHNLRTFVECERSINARDVEAQKCASVLTQKAALLKTTLAPQQLFLIRASDEIVQAYLDHEHTRPEAFGLHRARLIADTRLSDNEETLLSTFRPHGPEAWSNLYDQISGELVCKMKSASGQEQAVGLAHASSLLRDADEGVRKEAWTAIQNAWQPHAPAGAAILNGLAGWRLEEATRRSRAAKRKIGFLESAIHGSNIRTETLEAMMEAVSGAREIGRRVIRARARAIGKDQLDAWDLLGAAPAANGTRRTFKEGLGLVREAFASSDPTMGDFVDMMMRNRWIEGRVLPAKRQGAYCTGFAKSRTPRVYQTYMGSVNDISTLAHELGHAYHSWVMRDLPTALRRYPMTLAETASIFAETLLADHVSHDPAAAFEISWQEADHAASFLLNIPARFEFEKNFYERREASGFVSHTELSALYEESWRKWYGDTLGQVERQYWMTKLHFSLSSVSFYNFPYTFGALFALSVYSRRHEYGAEFLPKYVALLRDTGSMTAEDLALKHLGENISQPEFWQKSLALMDKQVARFERLMQPPQMRQ